MPEVTRSDLEDKLDVKKFKMFLRDLRDLAQAADRRISSRRAGSSRIASVDEQQLHDLATVAAYLSARANDHGTITEQLRKRDPSLTEADLGRVFKYAHQFYGKRMPNLEVQKNAQAYNAKMGLPPHQRLKYAPVDIERAQKIAEDYENLPSTPPDPKTPEGRKSAAAYAALVKEVNEQFNHLPIKIIPWDKPGQPYQNSREMMEDIADNGRMFVFYGGDDHPYLSRDENFKFRAIHDYYGHAAHGFEFGPRGEENAWLQHSQMFSPEAIPAMTAETRGQNSWVNYGKFGRQNRENPEATQYATQKAHVLPDEHTQHSAKPFVFTGSRRADVVQLIAANPFPVSPDMLAFAKEFREEIETFARTHRPVPEDGEVFTFGTSFITGPNQDKIKVEARVQQDSSEGIAGAAMSIPPEGNTDRHATILMRVDLQQSPDDPYGKSYWNGVEETILHEVIHCFDPKTRRRDLRMKFHPAGQMWRERQDPKSERGRIPYLKTQVERTAYEGQLRSRFEIMKRSGVSRARAWEYLKSMIETPELTSRSQYEMDVMHEKKARKAFMSRLVKIFESVYGDES